MINYQLAKILLAITHKCNETYFCQMIKINSDIGGEERFSCDEWYALCRMDSSRDSKRLRQNSRLTSFLRPTEIRERNAYRIQDDLLDENGYYKTDRHVCV